MERWSEAKTIVIVGVCVPLAFALSAFLIGLCVYALCQAAGGNCVAEL